MSKIARLYKIVNNVNGKCYIGVTTKTVQKRFNQHTNPKNKCIKLRNAIQKYGKENFQIEEMAVGSAEYIYNLEKLAIFEYKTLHPHGYNLAHGGRCSSNLESTLGKMSSSRKGKTFCKGEDIGSSKLTEEQVVFIIESNLQISELAKLYNINNSVVSEIKAGTLWKHIPRDSMKPSIKYKGKPVYVEGFIFHSIGLASDVLGVERGTLTNRLKSPNFTEYRFLSENKRKRKVKTLSEEDVMFILSSPDRTNSELAELFNTTKSYVCAIRNGRYWKQYTNGITQNYTKEWRGNPVYIDGFIFQSLTKASDVLRKPNTTLHRWVKNNKHNCSYLPS